MQRVIYNDLQHTKYLLLSLRWKEYNVSLQDLFPTDKHKLMTIISQTLHFSHHRLTEYH